LASQLAPEMEDPWLFLAYLAEPVDGLKYLDQALALNPASNRARKGIQYIINKLHDQDQIVPAGYEKYTESGLPSPKPNESIHEKQQAVKKGRTLPISSQTGVVTIGNLGQNSKPPKMESSIIPDHELAKGELPPDNQKLETSETDLLIKNDNPSSFVDQVFKESGLPLSQPDEMIPENGHKPEEDSPQLDYAQPEVVYSAELDLLQKAGDFPGTPAEDQVVESVVGPENKIAQADPLSESQIIESAETGPVNEPQLSLRKKREKGLRRIDFVIIFIFLFIILTLSISLAIVLYTNQLLPFIK
jgi:hypothetical protein